MSKLSLLISVLAVLSLDAIANQHCELAKTYLDGLSKDTRVLAALKAQDAYEKQVSSLTYIQTKSMWEHVKASTTSLAKAVRDNKELECQLELLDLKSSVTSLIN